MIHHMLNTLPMCCAGYPARSEHVPGLCRPCAMPCADLRRCVPLPLTSGFMLKPAVCRVNRPDMVIRPFPGESPLPAGPRRWPAQATVRCSDSLTWHANARRRVTRAYARRSSSAPRARTPRRLGRSDVDQPLRRSARRSGRGHHHPQVPLPVAPR